MIGFSCLRIGSLYPRKNADHTPVVPADFDYSGPFRMTNSLFLSQSSDAHQSVGYMWGKGSLFLETTFARTERIKKYLKRATEQTTISVRNYQL
jgi:hypothetical protein